MLLKNKYEFVLEDGINRWYVDSHRKSEIGSRIVQGKELVKEYDVFLVLNYDYMQELYKTNALDDFYIFVKKFKWVIKNKGIMGLFKICMSHMKGKNRKNSDKLEEG